LKEFLPHLIEENCVQKSRDLFDREVRILYKIAHPQIPKFLACFEDNGRLFLVQEYVEGKTYSTLLKERLSQQGIAFSEAEVIQWLQQLLRVLDYIHQHDIIHQSSSTT
jgi:serine/threonine-protein kinase